MEWPLSDLTHSHGILYAFLCFSRYCIPPLKYPVTLGFQFQLKTSTVWRVYSRYGYWHCFSVSWSKHCLVWKENQLLRPQWGDYSILSNNSIVWDLSSQGFVLRIFGSPSITSGIIKKLNKDTARCWPPRFKYMSVSREKAKWINYLFVTKPSCYLKRGGLQL